MYVAETVLIEYRKFCHNKQTSLSNRAHVISRATGVSKIDEMYARKTAEYDAQQRSPTVVESFQLQSSKRPDDAPNHSLRTWIHPSPLSIIATTIIQQHAKRNCQALLNES